MADSNRHVSPDRQRGGAARAQASSTGEPDTTESPLPRGLSWLVDGYNVMHACLLAGTGRDRWWTAESRELVLARASRFRDPEAEIWVVFDGGDASQQIYETPPALESEAGEPTPVGAPAAVHVVFAPSADDWITRRVRQTEEPSRIAVVTGDRQIAGRCAHRGAHVLRPPAFLAACGKPGSTVP